MMIFDFEVEYREGKKMGLVDELFQKLKTKEITKKNKKTSSKNLMKMAILCQK